MLAAKQAGHRSSYWNADALYRLGEILVKDPIYWVIPYPFNPFAAISFSTWR